METKKTSSLTRKEHSLFLNEASLLLKEVAFFEGSLEDLKFCTIGDPKKSLQVAKFVCETRRYTRTISRLQAELYALEEGTAPNLQNESFVTKSEKYFRTELKDFYAGYHIYKKDLKVFVASFNQREMEPA